MKFKVDDFEKPCGCRSVGECTHNTFSEGKALDAMVNAFAKEMKKRLRSKWLNGRNGWDSEEWTPEKIKAALIESISKGDPVDIANFAAFLWNKQ